MISSPRFHPTARRGSLLIYALVILTTLIAFCSLGVDYGQVTLAREELQIAADSAARYAASLLPQGASAARTGAYNAALQNTCVGQAVTLDSNNDIEFGAWDSVAETFTVLPKADENNANAVRVTARRLAARGTGVPLIFASVIGKATCDASRSTIALLTPGTGGDSTVVGLDGVKVSGSAKIDSYNSAGGNYSSDSAASKAIVGSNDDITLSGSAKIKGDAHPGSTGSVSTSGSSSVSGNTAGNSSELTYTSVDSSSAASSNNNSSIPSKYLNSSKDLSLGGSDALTLPAGTYYFRKVSLGGSGKLTIGGNVTMYVTGKFSMGGSASMNQIRPNQLKIKVDGANDFSLSGSVTLYADVFAPESEISLGGSTALCGAGIGKKLTLSGSSALHYDESLSSGSGSSTTATISSVK